MSSAHEAGGRWCAIHDVAAAVALLVLLAAHPILPQFVLPALLVIVVAGERQCGGRLGWGHLVSIHLASISSSAEPRKHKRNI
jgi:hypothetical protein